MLEVWQTFKLGELCEKVVTGGTPLTRIPEYYFDGDIPWLKTKEVNFCRINETENFITEAGLANSSAKLVPINSVIIAMYGQGDTAGRVAINKIPLATNQACCNLVIAKKMADYQFIYYYLRLSYSELVNLKTGSAQPNLNTQILKNFEITIPPLQEQRAIASILSALDNKIELNLQMNKTLEEMAMALYKHWFVDYGPFQNGEFVDSELGMIPKGWEVKRLDTLVSFSNGYAFKSKQLLKNEEEDCLHVFKMGHIKKGGGLKPDGTKSWVRKSDCIGLSKYILKVGDILMSMTDMKDNMTILGHTALMNENEKYIVNQRVGLLRVKNKINVGYPFIYILTNSYDYIERLRSQANSGVQVNLSTDAIKSSLVVTPTQDINEKFQNIALPYFEQINQNAIENQTLTTLRNTLLPKLISGEVRVKDIEQTIAQML